MTDLKISLVELFHWSLYDIDQADFESTLKFMRRFTAMRRQPRQERFTMAYCDQVSWL